MDDDIISEIKEELESGGNWPYTPQGHKFHQNPFSEQWPGPRVFAGHEEELKRLQENVQRNINTFITGPLGVGKTILAKTLYEILIDVDGFQPVFVPVQKGRFGKKMAQKILRELGVTYDSTVSKNDLYDLITEELHSTYQDGVRTVIFYDEVINGSEGTLRDILFLQRDIDNWEPVLVFNGTTHMMDQIRAEIEPLVDRIGDQIHLEDIDFESTLDLVNRRLRYFCERSEWNNSGCTHDDAGITPFTREAVDFVHQDITPYPRNLRHEFNTLMEFGARHELDEINYETAQSVSEESAQEKVSRIPDQAIPILEYLIEDGKASVNAISEALGMSSYTIREHLERIEEEGLIRATRAGRGVQYKPTQQAEKGLTNLREA